ncbi:MAG: septum formation protein Maf [Sphingomonadales bacterium BRH_c42]|nr:MAG: septum formation protein Maf [Sphingomonadales bacterium BRH_c42]
MTLILASASASRRAMLEAAGVAFTVCPAAIDERMVEAGLAGHPAAPTAADVARALAEAKAQAVEARGALVLGSDSLVMVDGLRFDKPASREDAARHLRGFSGQTMELHSAAALARSGEVVWSYAALARLQVRELSDAFIEHYLDAEWPAIGHCVGCFRIEGPGVQLFKEIEGDHFTVLGMPLLAVLGALRDLGELES